MWIFFVEQVKYIVNISEAKSQDVCGGHTKVYRKAYSIYVAPGKSAEKAVQWEKDHLWTNTK